MANKSIQVDELDLYRALQTLKDQDGNYVLSTISFSSQYGLHRLIEFIEALIQQKQLEARLDEADYHRHTADSIVKGIRYENNQKYYMDRAIELDVRIARYEKELAILERKP